jgi:hypothetical protein
LYLDQQSVDTTTPAGKLMFQITARLPPNRRNHFGVPSPESWSGCRPEPTFRRVLENIREFQLVA